MRIQTLIRGIEQLKNWPQWLKEYLGLLKTNEPLIAYKFRDGLMLLERPYTADRGIIQEVLLHNCYGEFYDVCPDDTVIDIGAQAGFYAASAINKGAKKVIAFEPIEENYELAKMNLENALDKVGYDGQEYELYNTAIVGTDVDYLDIYEDPNNSGGHSAFSNNDNGGNYERVLVDNINTIIDKLLEVNILKCDCEGGEYDIIFNMTDENLKKVDCMVLELHPLGDGKMPFDITRHLQKKGFKIYTKSKSLSELCVVYAVRDNGQS